MDLNWTVEEMRAQPVSATQANQEQEQREVVRTGIGPALAWWSGIDRLAKAPWSAGVHKTGPGGDIPRPICVVCNIQNSRACMVSP